MLMNNTHLSCQMTTWMAKVAYLYVTVGMTNQLNVTKKTEDNYFKFQHPLPAWISIVFTPSPPLTPYLPENFQKLICRVSVFFFWNNPMQLFAKPIIIVHSLFYFCFIFDCI